MQAIEEKGVIKKYVNDPDRIIPKVHLESVCKIGCKEKTCKFIMKNSNDIFICAKNSPLGKVLDDLSKDNSISAKADNCPGLKNKKETR